MDKALKILILEDNPADVELIKWEIKKSGIVFISEEVDNKESYTRALDEFDPDLILSDHSLPQFNSLDALNIFKTKKKTIPFILVTGSVSEEFAVQTIKEGADDYLLKSNLIRLPAAIRNAINQKKVKLEKEMAQEALRRSEKQYRQIVETAQEGIWMLDAQNKTIFVNKKLCEILEYSEEEMLGKENSYFMDEEGKSVSQLSLERRKKGIQENVDLSFMTKSGKRIWTNLSASPITNPDGTYVGALGMITDITQRKNSEIILEKQNTELIKVNSELDRFVYSASHELRAPLTSVLGLLNLTKSDEKDPEQISKMHMMETSIQRLDSFIQDIVHYSRNSRLSLENEAIDFKILIGECISELQYMEETNTVHINLQVDNNSPFYSDKKRIRVILNNLLSNAIKYHNSEQKNPFINIEVTVGEESAEVKISDNGIGIPATSIDKIFNMFYRATEKKTGSGIGLFIVKEIIDKMHGDISVSSEPGKPTIFKFNLPNLKTTV